MRTSSDELLEVLKGSFDKRYVADVYYDGARVLTDVPITDPKFDDDDSSLVQGTGSCTVVYSGTFADSLSPTQAQDILAPFGTELAVYVLISAGQSFSERIQLGWYRIIEVPSADDAVAKFLDTWITVGSTVELKLQDRMQRVQQDTFDVPGSPPSLASVWTEVGRLTQLQLTRSVTDAVIPRATAYESDRLQAVYDLVDVLDAVPCMLPDGTLGARPNTWPGVVDQLETGDRGSLISVGNAMSSDTVYNRVVVRTSSSDQQAVLAAVQIKDGPLRAVNLDGTPSPYGRKTYFYSSDFITTPTQAMAYATQLLPRVSNLRARSVPIGETFNPLRELGDVLDIVRPQGRITGRVSKISRDDGETQTLTLEVQ